MKSIEGYSVVDLVYEDLVGPGELETKQKCSERREYVPVGFAPPSLAATIRALLFNPDSPWFYRI